MLIKQIKNMNVDELIKATASFIPELYKAMKREIALKKSSNNKKSSLLSHVRDMEIAVDFILIDLSVSIKAVSQVKGAYEGRFHIKNLLAILSEGYKLVYGFGNRRGKSIWGCLKKYISKYEGGKHLSRYNEITSSLDGFGTTHINQDLRNLTLHYDDNMMKVYQGTANIYSFDEACCNAMAFMNILKKMMEFGIDVCKGLKAEPMDVKEFQIPTYPLYNDRLHGIFKKVIDKDGGLENNLKSFLTTNAGKSLDRIAVTCKSIERIKAKAKELKIANDMPEMKDLYILSNLQMLMQFMELDLACVFYSWLISTSGIEGVMILRRITIIKVAVLSHLVGYEENEKQRSIWTLIKAMIPPEDKSIVNEVEQIEEAFLKLVDNENDRRERNVYVHYIEGSKQIKLASIADSIENLDLFKTIKDVQLMVQLYPKIQKFSKHLMNLLCEQAHARSIESTNALLTQNNKIRELILISKMEDKDKNVLLAKIDDMGEFIKGLSNNKGWSRDIANAT